MASETRIEVRSAVPGDSAALANLAGQLGYRSSAEEVARRLGESRKSPEHEVFVVHLSTGEIIGWISLCVYRTIASDPRVEITGFVVDEKHRSRRVGAALLKRAEEWAMAKRYREIGVHCNVIRERAHTFYQRNGYREEKTQKVFRKTLAG